MEYHPAFKYRPRLMRSGLVLAASPFIAVSVVSVLTDGLDGGLAVWVFAVIPTFLALVSPRAGGWWFVLQGVVLTFVMWIWIEAADMQARGPKPQGEVVSDVALLVGLALPVVGGALLLFGNNSYRAAMRARQLAAQARHAERTRDQMRELTSLHEQRDAGTITPAEYRRRADSVLDGTVDGPSGSQPVRAPGSPPVGALSPDVVRQLDELLALRNSGAISSEEHRARVGHVLSADKPPVGDPD